MHQVLINATLKSPMNAEGASRKGESLRHKTEHGQ
jgi:hypothetical protein